MASRIIQALGGNRLMARVARSASWIVLGYGASQAIRLGSNLILTRLLFPEAFGLMALLSVITVGLTLFSDVGISPSIAQSKRGDDAAFLNTAWSIQVVRGLVLWLIACGLAYPVALFYDQPDIATYLPLSALTLVIAGFNPTRIETAHRHLLMGRLTALDLMSQVIGIIVMIVLALILQSVLALVIGGVVGAFAKLALTHLFLPGEGNRFQLERAAFKELISYGKWIFLSTLFWFFASQGDKAVLGKFLSLETLGIYNIGYFLASFPFMLGQTINGRIMIPVHRENAPVRRVKLLRYGVSGGVIGLLIVMGLLGPWLIGVLYDARYQMAGAIVVLVAIGLIPQIIGMTYGQAALAAGDSRRLFFCSAIAAVLQIAFLIIGVSLAGLVGAIAGMSLSMVLAHFAMIWVARAHGVWDPVHDLVFTVLAVGAAGLALWLHYDAIVALLAVAG